MQTKEKEGRGTKERKRRQNIDEQSNRRRHKLRHTLV